MKIDRALIIRMENNEMSMEYAEGCAESCEEHGLPYEFIEAVDAREYTTTDEILRTVGSFSANGYDNNRKGNVGCHASMIKCWKRICEIGAPCVILEHDSLVLGDVTTLDIPDMAVVTFGHRVSESNEYIPPRPAEELVEIPKAIGVHACGLSPATAQWLYEDATTNGVSMGVDRYLIMTRCTGLPLYVCDPPQVVCWVRETTIRKAGKRDVVNYKEALTESWYEGLTEEDDYRKHFGEHPHRIKKGH